MEDERELEDGSYRVHQNTYIQAQIQVGPAAGAPPPGAVREGPLYYYIIAKNSLKTRLKYIKITIKVDF